MNTSLQKLAIGVAVLATLSGCAQFQEHQSQRWTKKLAQQAYETSPCAEEDGPTARDFERGWRKAYFDVARGGDGQPPVLPPQAYWAVKYQNPEGAQQIAAWYEGYLLGASAACRDGVGRYTVIPTSPLDNGCCSSGGCCGSNCGNGRCGAGGCASCSNCSSCDVPMMSPQAMPGEMMPAMMPGPVAPIIEYVMPPLSDARPMIQSLPPVGPDALAEPAMIQVAETRPLNPTLVGPRYDSQVQQVDYTEPMQPAQ